MRRFKDSVFDDVPIWMTGGGFAAGLLLPVFMLLIGVPAESALRWTGFVGGAVLGAGLGYGGARLSLKLVRPELRAQAVSMHEIGEVLREMSIIKDWSSSAIENCRLPDTSDDELSQMAETFNEMVEELVHVHRLEAASTEQTETLSSKLDMEALSQDAVRLLLEQTEANAGCLLALLEGEFKTVANIGLRDTEGIAESDRVQRALETFAPQYLRVPDSVAIDGVVTDYRPRQVVILPISYEGQGLGVVVLASDTMFGKESMWILDLFTKGMGLALNNAVMHTKLQRIAAMDGLTGVYNRRLGMKRLRDEFLRAERDGAKLAVAMFDIDHFKKVNDTYGHLVGDRVLTAVAHTARDVLRESDVILRYGGEEFLVVLPGAASADALAVGERIRKEVEACVIEDGEREVRVTVSVGLSEYDPEHVEAEEDLVKKADDALYTAKESGRNRVVHATQRPAASTEDPAGDPSPETCATP